MNEQLMTEFAQWLERLSAPPYALSSLEAAVLGWVLSRGKESMTVGRVATQLGIERALVMRTVDTLSAEEWLTMNQERDHSAQWKIELGARAQHLLKIDIH